MTGENFDDKKVFSIYGVKAEDFHDHLVYPGMDGPDMVQFFVQHNYAAEMVEYFQPVGMWDHISRGVIRRRHPRSGNIALEEAVFVIDLDKYPSPVQIPWEVFQYAFEAQRGSTSLRLSVPDLVREVKQKFGPPINRPPRTTVKIFFVSPRKGLLIKGSASLLLLLAQERYAFPDLSPERLKIIAREWEMLYALAARAGMLSEAYKKSEEGVEKISMFPVLEISWDAINQIPAAIVGPDPDLESGDAIKQFTERLGELYAQDFLDEVWILRNYSSPPEENSALSWGDTFKWIPLYLWHFADLYQEWIDDADRIQRCERVGESYYTNTVYLGPPRRYDRGQHATSWDSLSLNFIRTRHLPENKVVLEDIEPPYAIREVAHPALSEITGMFKGTVDSFRTFFKTIFKRDLDLIAWRGSFLLFRTAPSDSAATVVFEEEGKDTQETFDVIVKCVEFENVFFGYYCGAQTYLDVFTEMGFPFRFFVFDPEERTIVEYDPGVLRDSSRKWLAGMSDVESLMCRVLYSRSHHLLNVDLLIGDFLSNPHYAINLGSKHGIKAVFGEWYFDEEQGIYAPYFSPEELGAYKTFLEYAGLGGDISLLHPVVASLVEQKFAKEHPDLYRLVMNAFERQEKFLSSQGLMGDEVSGVEDDLENEFDLGEEEEVDESEEQPLEPGSSGYVAQQEIEHDEYNSLKAWWEEQKQELEEYKKNASEDEKKDLAWIEEMVKNIIAENKEEKGQKPEWIWW